MSLFQIVPQGRLYCSFFSFKHLNMMKAYNLSFSTKLRSISLVLGGEINLSLFQIVPQGRFYSSFFSFKHLYMMKACDLSFSTKLRSISLVSAGEGDKFVHLPNSTSKRVYCFFFLLHLKSIYLTIFQSVFKAFRMETCFVHYFPW